MKGIKGLAVSISIMALVSCGGGGGSDSDDEMGGVSQTVGPAGGTVNDPDGASIQIPAGALSQDTVIKVQALDEPATLPAPAPFFAGVRFGPDGLTFSSPATITITLPQPATVGAIVELFDYDSENDAWTPSGITALVDPGGFTASAQITHFSYYVLMEIVESAGDPERYFGVLDDALGDVCNTTPVADIFADFMAHWTNNLYPLGAKLVRDYSAYAPHLDYGCYETSGISVTLEIERFIPDPEGGWMLQDRRIYGELEGEEGDLSMVFRNEADRSISSLACGEKRFIYIVEINVWSKRIEPDMSLQIEADKMCMDDAANVETTLMCGQEPLVGQTIDYSVTGAGTVVEGFGVTDGSGIAEDVYVAIDMGKATVEAEFEWWQQAPGPMTKTTQVKVHNVERIELDPSSSDLCIDETEAIGARLFDMDDEEHQCYEINWHNSNSTAVHLSPLTGANTGAVGIEQGASTVTAESEGTTNSMVVSVKGDCLVVVPPEVCKNASDSVQFTLIADPSVDLDEITWASSNNGVATVDSTGLASTHSNGDALITATDGNLVGDAVLYVRDKCIEIYPPEPCLLEGDTVLLELRSPLDLDSYELTWVSYDDGVAQVDSSGNVTAVSSGSTEIEVEADNGTDQYIDTVPAEIPAFPEDYQHALLAEVNSRSGYSTAIAFLTNKREVISNPDLHQRVAQAGVSCGYLDLGDMYIADVNSSGAVVGGWIEDELSVIFDPQSCMRRNITSFGTTGINNHGLVVGSTSIPASEQCPYYSGILGESVGVIYDNGSYEEVDLQDRVPDIAPHLLRYFHTSFIDVNDDGLILGSFSESYDEASCTDPEDPSTCDCRRMGGFWPTNVFGNRRTVYFVYDRSTGNFQEIEFPDFDDPGVTDDDTIAYKINNRGDVVGYWTDTDMMGDGVGRQGFIFDGESGQYIIPLGVYLTDRPTFYSVNSSRDILGAYINSPPTPNDFLLHLCPIPMAGDPCTWLDPADYDHIAEFEPVELTCDGLDNDCNGYIDDDLLALPNSKQAGVCEGSEQTCYGEMGWLDDYSDIPDFEDLEITCDGLDNDCDGFKDEGCNPRVTGRVVDSRGNPVPSATVTITSDPVVTNTGLSGNFMAFVETGDHTITISKNGETIYTNNFSIPSMEPLDLGTLTPEGGGTTYNPWYYDSDNDGYGDPDVFVTDVTPPPQYVENGSDCNDFSASVHPGADDVCNDIDDNCDGSVDEGLPLSTYFVDGDGDEYGIPPDPIRSCLATPPSGYAGVSTDCDDSSAAVNPGAEEDCNGIDDDCDLDTDEDFNGDPLVSSCYTGPPATEGIGQCQPGQQVCTVGAWAACIGEVLPVDEICDGLDNNCDGTPDDGFPVSTYYLDDDGDGYGDPAGILETCLDAPPEGYSADSTDCDDTTAGRYPGLAEVCGDGIDQDCSGTDMSCDLDFDDDGDGYTENQGDCDDSKDYTYPGAPDLCDGLDNDCDPEVDEDVAYLTLYSDADGDGFGTAGATTLWCAPVAGYLPFDGDCADADSTINPRAFEDCNDAIDQDCSGADLPCPPISMQASTIAPIAAGSWWDYWVTGDDSGWLERYVYPGTVASPETGQETMDVEDYFDLSSRWLLIDRYWFQDSDGTIRQAGIWWEDEETENWITSGTGDGGNYVLYPSPLNSGQAGSTVFSYDTPGYNAAYSYSVHDAEVVGTYAGSIEAFRITTEYAESWPALGITPAEDYYEESTVWLHPELGEVKRDHYFENYLGGVLDEEASISWTLDDGSWFEITDCGGLGSGTGNLSAFAGTWTGSGTDNPGLIGLYTNYAVSVAMDAMGNIEKITLNGVDQSVIMPDDSEQLTTGALTPRDDTFYTIEFADFGSAGTSTTGRIMVDDNFSYMIFMADSAFDDFGKDFFFAVLEKGVPAHTGHSRDAAIGTFYGSGYDFCTQVSDSYRFEHAGVTIFPPAPVIPYLPIQGTDPHGSFDLNLFGWDADYGYGGGAAPDGADTLRIFLSPDGEFIGGYRTIRAEGPFWQKLGFYLLMRQ